MLEIIQQWVSAPFSTGALPEELEEEITIESASLLPINIKTALPRFGGDITFFIEILEEFLDAAPEKIHDLKTTAAAGKAIDLSKLAHGLKGVSRNFSAGNLTALVTELEQASKDGLLSKAPGLVNEIEDEMERIRDFYQTVQAEHSLNID